MNMNQIINMVVRQIMRRFINKGVNAGINQAGKMMSGNKGRGANAQQNRRG